MFKCKVKYSPQHFLFFSVWEVSQYKLECVFTVDPYILRKTILNINYSLVRIFSFTSITSVNNWKKKKNLKPNKQIQTSFTEFQHSRKTWCLPRPWMLPIIFTHQNSLLTTMILSLLLWSSLKQFKQPLELLQHIQTKLIWKLKLYCNTRL